MSSHHGRVARIPSAAAGMRASFVVAATLTATAVAAPADFAREIQPLLARRCFSCHGPETQEAGLRLDLAEAATRELDSGARAIAPGDEAASAILVRVTAEDPDLRMPPEGGRLSAAEIAALRRWIAAGAEYRPHWAFRPVERPAVPPAPTGTHPIDAFVRAGLAARGLPVPPGADRRTLLRRATYGVTGLPPSEQALREFLTDASPDAWRKVVERLLASPHYGEHWARHWLDLVRYADTNSFERDGDKPHAWRYRDYVIRSFNDDKPYDRFVTEQLAGDEAESPTPDELVATGYYRLGIWDDEPADAVQARYDWLDDIVSTTGQTFLGLTIGCGRCHDHKIDPITQRDYSALLAFVHNVTPMGGRTMAAEHIERPLFPDAEARRRHEAAVADLQARRRDAQLAVTAIEERFRAAWEAENETTVVGGDLDGLEFRFYRDAWTSLPAFDELKAEDTGFVTGNLFDIGVAPSLRPDNFGYVFTGFLKVPAEGDYTFTLDSDDGSRLTVAGRVVLLHDGIHGEGSPRSATVRLPAGRLPIRLDYFQGLFGRGLTVTWSGPAFPPRSLSAVPNLKGKDSRQEAGFDLAAALRIDGERILGPDVMRDLAAKQKALARLDKEEVPVDKALVVSEHGPEAPDTFVFFRGNPRADTTPEQRVGPAFPAVFQQPPPVIVPTADGRSSGRRTALARWIAAPANPLTARVIVNRIWQHHFGRGLVRSTSNFGLMGDPPTHPELLDWLASELVAGGWRLKRLHELILTSEAYRATSAATPEGLAADPLNDALWRFDRRRLAAEELRDSIHVTSGEFNPRMYGPGVYPAIPRAVMAGQSRPGDGWRSSPPEEQARRSVYAHLKRSLVTPILADFDAADTDTTCPVRFVTTQPTQALGMMNGEFLQRQAKVFASRVRREVADDDPAALVARALALALVRPATAAEVSHGLDLLDRLEGTAGITPSRAFELYCLMVLNLNEFCYLD